MTYIPDPANYTMKGNIEPKPQPIPVVKPYIAELTDEQLRKLAREKLSEALQAVDASKERDLAIRLSNAVLDRVDGKPSQAIAMTVEDKGLGKLSDERLLRLEATLSKMVGCEAIIIPPMPTKLQVDEW